MNDKPQSDVRVVAATPSAVTDDIALRKVARAVISIAARQTQREAEEEQHAASSEEEGGRV